MSETDTSTQTTTWVYERLTTSVTDAEGHVRAFTTDAEGNLTAVQEPAPGGTTSYDYTPWGELTAVSDAGGHVTTMAYDERGFRTGVNDPDAGSSTYEYTLWGELYRMRDARTAAPNWTLTNDYDALGRLRVRVDYDPVAGTSATTTWSYYTTNDTASGARLGLLETATSYAGAVGSSTIEFQETYKYNGKALVRQKNTHINGGPQWSYFTNMTYNAYGQLESITYPLTVNNLKPRFDYTYSNGYLDIVTQVVMVNNVEVKYPRYNLEAMDASGRESYAQLGSGALNVQSLYDRVNGLVREIRTGPGTDTTVQNLAYGWDKVGNLTSRTDHNQNLTEAFSYDALNRLTGSTLNGVTNLTTSYAADGNLDAKRRPDGSLDSYSYLTPGKPHAVSATTQGTSTDYYTYDAAGQLLTRAHDSPSAFNRWVSWTAFGKPKQVSAGAANCAADCTTFTYGPERQLVKQVVKTAGATRSIYYIGPHFEVEVGGSVTEYRSHALANGRVVFSQIEDTGGSGGVGWQAYYPLVDHLGSVDKQYKAAGTGDPTIGYSYDAFGRRRNADWSDDAGGTQMTATLWNHQGYTGVSGQTTASLR